MSRTSMTRKHLLVTIALGLSGLGATSMPAAALPFSQFVHASPMQVFPHQGGSIGSGAASQKPGSPIQKGPVPMSGSASSNPYISQTIGNQQLKVPMPAPSAPGPIASQTIGNQPLKVPMPTTQPPLPPQPPIPHCEALPKCPGNPPPHTGDNVSINLPSINIARPPVVYGGAPVAMAQAPMMAQQPVIVPRQPVAPVTTAASEPASCLTKQYLNDGSALFRDNCTGEAAIATQAQLQAEAQARAAQVQAATSQAQSPVQTSSN